MPLILRPGLALYLQIRSGGTWRSQDLVETQTAETFQ